MEEMEKRSRRRTRDLVTQAASQGLSENEIGCARISMMARSTNAPFKGRIQKRQDQSSPHHHIRLATQGRSIQTCQKATSHLCPTTTAAGRANPPHLPVVLLRRWDSVTVGLHRLRQ